MKTQHSNNLLPHLILNVGTILTMAFMLFVYNTWAAPSLQAPGVIPYQGVLTDDIGQPIIGNVGMTFRLYNQPTGGTALWSEAHTGVNAVPVQVGQFHVLLGSLTPISSTVWANSPLYVGVQITGESEMSPREIVGAVPYAYYADRAIQADTALTVSDKAIKSRHAELTNGRKAASGTVILTSSAQTMPGTQITLTPDTDQTYLFYVTLDMQLNDSVGIGHFVVDGVSQSSQAIFQSTGWGRSTVSQTYLVNFSSGTHTVELKASLVSGSTGTAYAEHTTITYLAVSQ